MQLKTLNKVITSMDDWLVRF